MSRRPQTRTEQVAGFLLGLVLLVFVIGLCINYSIQNNNSRDARDQYTQDTGCTWSGDEFNGYHMEC